MIRQCYIGFITITLLFTASIADAYVLNQHFSVQLNQVYGAYSNGQPNPAKNAQCRVLLRTITHQKFSGAYHINSVTLHETGQITFLGHKQAAYPEGLTQNYSFMTSSPNPKLPNSFAHFTVSKLGLLNQVTVLVPEGKFSCMLEYNS